MWPGACLGTRVEAVSFRFCICAQNTGGNVGQETLLSAAAMGQLRVVRALLECKVDARAVNDEGETALHLAALRCHEDHLVTEWLEVCKLLKERGADLDETRDKAGRTARDLGLVARLPELREWFIAQVAPHSSTTLFTLYSLKNYRGVIWTGIIVTTSLLTHLQPAKCGRHVMSLTSIARWHSR